jgi:hypothetical protein
MLKGDNKMKALYELKEKFEMELEELARKGELGAGDLELAHKLTDTIKNIDKICALEEDGGYSEAGDWEGRGSYNRGSSYANRGKHYVRGHYSRDGYSNRGYSRESGYSRHDAKEQMMAQLEDMMGSVSNEREREAIRRCMEQLDRE